LEQRRFPDSLKTLGLKKAAVSLSTQSEEAAQSDIPSSLSNIHSILTKPSKQHFMLFFAPVDLLTQALDTIAVSCERDRDRDRDWV